MWRIGAAVLALVVWLPVAPAHAADPGRWKLTGTTSLPLFYYQGVTADPARNLYFDGVYVGLYRTDSAFTRDRPHRRRDPARRALARGLQPHRRHQLGPRRGRARPAAARVLRPERAQRRQPVPARLDRRRRSGARCSGATTSSSTPPRSRRRCGTRSRPTGRCCGPRAATTCSPTGRPTSRAANASPEHAPIHSVRRLRGAVPPSGITGATFIDGRLYVAGQGGGPFRV